MWKTCFVLDVSEVGKIYQDANNIVKVLRFFKVLL